MKRYRITTTITDDLTGEEVKSTFAFFEVPDPAPSLLEAEPILHIPARDHSGRGRRISYDKASLEADLIAGMDLQACADKHGIKYGNVAMHKTRLRAEGRIAPRGTPKGAEVPSTPVPEAKRGPIEPLEPREYMTERDYKLVRAHPDGFVSGDLDRATAMRLVSVPAREYEIAHKCSTYDAYRRHD